MTGPADLVAGQNFRLRRIWHTMAIAIVRAA